MLSNLKSRINILNRCKVEDCDASEVEVSQKPNRNEYGRPGFLELTEDEFRASDNHETRPIIVPKSDTALPWGAGYAECVCTRVKQNEDQAAVGRIKLNHQLTADQTVVCPGGSQACEASLLGVYFGVFDGHGGPGAALMVADQLINHLQEKLVDVRKELFDLALKECGECQRSPHNAPPSDTPTAPPTLYDCVTFDDLVVGALEAAFHAMDEQIGGEKASFNITGGCCTQVALFLHGKLYLANAGDCRAVAYLGDQLIPLSTDFTADQDADRIYTLARLQPELTGGHFSTSPFHCTVHKADLGHRLLWRPPGTRGWSNKEVTDADINFPLIRGSRKSSRLMNCIGVSRSLGDHDLRDIYTNLHVKPFISCTPEVKVMDLRGQEVKDTDVVVMGSDGLWDMVSNQAMGQLVREALTTAIDQQEGNRYSHAAQQAVLRARGTRDVDRPGWNTVQGEEPSHDDITALVIPLSLVPESTRLVLSSV